MNTARLESRDLRLILIAAAIIVVSLVYTRANFWAAFPQASIDLKYSKEEITAQAEKFLRTRGLEPAKYRNLTLFDDDSNARYYLERELGLPEANRLMAGPVSAWFWRARWIRPPEKEEYVAWLSPTGRLVGFDHVIPEDQAGARLTKEQARELAYQFLKQQSAEPHKLVNEQVHERPKRLDYDFTWEVEGFRAKEATYRRHIVVRGDQIGYYGEFLKVPEQWLRDFERMRSKNALFQTIAESLYLPLAIAALLFIFRFVRRGEMKWRTMLLAAGAVALFNLGNNYNSLPFTLDRMPTSSPFLQSLALALLQGLGAAVAVFFFVILAGAAGEPLYRADFPRFLSLRFAFSPRGVQTREFFRATVAGYAMAAGHIAFVVAFYVIGQKIGVWSPQEVEYSDLLGTVAPWIAPLAISMLAASSEEFWFRLFAVPMLSRFLPRWVAIIVPALVWGFLHSNYPQQPGYVRGIEVGLIGIVAGVVMLRFGILATLVWHYTVDAVLIGMFLFQSKSLYFQMSGLVVSGVVMLPLIVSLVLYWRRGGFLEDDAAMNAAAPPPLPSTTEQDTAPEAPLAPRRKLMWLLVPAGVCAVAAAFVHEPVFGDFIRVRASRLQAAVACDQEMTNRGRKLAEWMQVTSFWANLELPEFEYLRRQVGAVKANRAVAEWRATGIWWTRYFKPLQKEEWRVYTDSNGKVYRVDHELDEKAPGKNLETEDARQIAREYLLYSHGMHPDKLKMVDERSEKRDNRTDHNFTWEDESRKIGEARARLSFGVIGNEISGYHRFWKLPEEWVREFQKPRIRKVLIPALMGAMALALLVAFVMRLGARTHFYQWRLYAGVTGLMTALALAAAFNGWQQNLANYGTATPLDSFRAQTLMMSFAGVLVTGLGAFIGVFAFDVFRQAYEGRRPMPPMNLARVIAAALLIGGGGAVLGWIDSVAPGPRDTLNFWGIAGIDHAYPVIAVLRNAFGSALFNLCAVGASGFFLARMLKPKWLLAALAAGCVVWAAGRAETPLQGVVFFATAAAGLAMVWLVYETCGADFVGVFAVLAVVTIVSNGIRMLGQPAPFLKWNGGVALAVAALVAILAGTRRIQRT